MGVGVVWIGLCVDFVSLRFVHPSYLWLTFSDMIDIFHFFLLLAPVEVILEVDIKSPMYFWRNLLFESSLSCSSFTASMRLKISRRES